MSGLESSLRELFKEELSPLLKELRAVKIAFLNMTFENRISFSLKEASLICGISYETLYNYYRSGRLPGRQVAGRGGSIIVLRQDLVNLIVAEHGDDFKISDLKLKKIARKNRKQ